MSQARLLYELLKDGSPHRVDEIIEKVYGMDRPSVARLSARIMDVKRQNRVEIKSWPDPQNKKLWFYQITKHYETPILEKPKKDWEKMAENMRRIQVHEASGKEKQLELFG